MAVWARRSHALAPVKLVSIPPAGATGFSPRATFDLTRLNLLGLGHTVTLQTRVSTIEQRAILSYLAPRVRNHDNLDLTFTVVYDNTHGVNTFAAKREEGSVQLAQKLSKPSTLLYRFATGASAPPI